MEQVEGEYAGDLQQSTFVVNDSVLISEEVFVGIQETLRKLYTSADVPKGVRRRILEASVRAMQDWHQDAIQTAYRSDDEAWKATAVFSMCWVRGFDCAAEVAAAWPHIAALVTSNETEKNCAWLPSTPWPASTPRRPG